MVAARYRNRDRTHAGKYCFNIKRHVMEKIKTPILLTTLYVFVYLAVCELDPTARWAIMLFSLSPLPVIWMVYRVLRDGTPSAYTFKERFYDDYKYARAEVREEGN